MTRTAAGSALLSICLAMGSGCSSSNESPSEQVDASPSDGGSTAVQPNDSSQASDNSVAMMTSDAGGSAVDVADVSAVVSDAMQEAAPQEAGPTCEGGTTACGAVCADLTTDPANCNTCGHIGAPANATAS